MRPSNSDRTPSRTGAYSRSTPFQAAQKWMITTGLSASTDNRSAARIGGVLGLQSSAIDTPPCLQRHASPGRW